jgi:hypothetical protein
VYVGARRGVATDFLAFSVPRTEPKRLEVSGDAILVDLTWRGWGTARATATGAVDKRGRPRGEFDPDTGEQVKPRVPGRRVEP